VDKHFEVFTSLFSNIKSLKEFHYTLPTPYLIIRLEERIYTPTFTRGTETNCDDYG
jgi:hypothetical protein